MALLYSAKEPKKGREKTNQFAVTVASESVRSTFRNRGGGQTKRRQGRKEAKQQKRALGEIKTGIGFSLDPLSPEQEESRAGKKKPKRGEKDRVGKRALGK